MNMQLTWWTACGIVQLTSWRTGNVWIVFCWRNHSMEKNVRVCCVFCPPSSLFSVFTIESIEVCHGWEGKITYVQYSGSLALALIHYVSIAFCLEVIPLLLVRLTLKLVFVGCHLTKSSYFPLLVLHNFSLLELKLFEIILKLNQYTSLTLVKLLVCQFFLYSWSIMQTLKMLVF